MEREAEAINDCVKPQRKHKNCGNSFVFLLFNRKHKKKKQRGKVSDSEENYQS